MTVMLLGYPEHPGGQVNVQRALTAVRKESEIKGRRTRMESGRMTEQINGVAGGQGQGHVEMGKTYPSFSNP